MPRIRTIKPEFFHHEELAEMSALHRLLFIGLWTLADREGRLEDRPKRIKAALLPWESCDMDAMLSDLDGAGLVHRYEVQGVACIDIPSFKKHQRPHPKEPALGLPHPPSREKTRLASNDLPAIPSSPVGREGKEIWEGKGREGNGTPPPEPAEVTPTPAPTPAAFDLEKLDALHRDRRGRDMEWGPARFRVAVERELGDLAVRLGPVEFMRRAENALTYPAGRFPYFAVANDLVRHTGHYAEPFSAARPREPADISRGHARAEKQDHTDHGHGF